MISDEDVWLLNLAVHVDHGGGGFRPLEPDDSAPECPRGCRRTMSGRLSTHGSLCVRIAPDR